MNTLQHHGVKGMKWGVRRYRNYDGSYTRAGMKRYNTSMEKYDKANAKYKSLKKSKADKSKIANAKISRNNAKRKLDKDYKHLKNDHLADQGKILYSNGVRIRGSKKVTSMINTIGVLTFSAAAYNAERRGSKSVTKSLAAIGAMSLGIGFGKSLYDEHRNARLRAYYTHTSNY